MRTFRKTEDALEGLLERVISQTTDTFWEDAATKTEAFAEVALLSAEQRAALALLACARLESLRADFDALSASSQWGVYGKCASRWWGAVSLVYALLNRQLPWSDTQLHELVSFFASEAIWGHRRSYSGLLKQLEADPERVRSNHDLKKRVEAIAQRHAEGATDAASRRICDRFDSVLGRGAAVYLTPGDAWSDQALADLGAMDDGARTAWHRLLRVCCEVLGGSPTAKWLRAAEQAREGVGDGAFVSTVVRWFALVDKPGTPERRPASMQLGPGDEHRILDAHMDILKGLCWIAGTIHDPDLARALGQLAISAYRKVPGVGPRAVKVGNAAVAALGRMPGMDAVGQLAMLRVKVKFGTAQRLIEKSLAAAAERAGLPREEIDELGVPAYGMTEVGRRTEELGAFRAELTVDAAGDAELRFVRPDGRSQKAVPAAVKEGFAEELKELKAAIKDIKAMLPAQRERIDALFLENRTWPLGVWRERYLDHPLVGLIARRLVWRFGDADARVWRSAAWLDGAGLVDTDGRPVDPAGAAVVRMWHPIEVERDEVLAWRRFFEERRIRQPFKQAHREVYLLTDAERATETYSNRFAAHIIKQHQFNALAARRGWKNKLRLLVDAEYPPATRVLRAWELRAEFWIEGVGEDFGTDTNEAGAYLYLTTDQVRFYAEGAAQARAHAGGGGYGPAWGAELAAGLPLERIPPLVFSEVMRDVDLFVGVCSVANNPQWSDGGPGGAYRSYWWEQGFGNLTQSGTGRRELLERLVPRLKIGPACSLTDRFLVVKGKLRTYKIHLGSGNILMEPNDEYLCIVPSARDGTESGKVFLPFEGDRTLSIILSKAFMLAEDDKIKDASITRQIGR